jgi:hypothetical protein
MNLPSTAPHELLELICSLEVKLHQSAVRSDKTQPEGLLHSDFSEYGRSGRTYDKAEILKHLEQESLTNAVWSQDFHLKLLAFSVALLTYKSAHINAQGELSCYALRSSVWQFSESGWQMRFHQATPCAPFAKNEAASAAALEIY